MLHLCQTAKAQPCGEVRLKLEAIGTFWMGPSCSQKVSWAPRRVRTAECYQSYLRCQHSDTEIMQFTHWHGNSPVKGLSSATMGKWEGKIEGPCFTCPPVMVVLFALRSLTPWQHRGEAAQDSPFPSLPSHTG